MIKFRNLPYKSMILEKVVEMINTQPSNSNNTIINTKKLDIKLLHLQTLQPAAAAAVSTWQSTN